ncbi:MAG: Vi polysaccharide biosynthesis UDP-N-acetylglucosamine C-6 dehydrogenase TviB, partial [Pseudomonadota bacterium]
MSNSTQPTIGIIGLGYVGLPLAIAFAKTRSVVAFDTDADRIAELQTGRDRTREVSCDELIHVETDIVYTSNETDLSVCSIFIITVPTPVDKANQPDLSQLKNASQT